MSARIIRLSQTHTSLVVPLLRESHCFSTDEEARDTFLSELDRSRDFRGVFFNQALCGLITWEERGMTKHGVAEIIRFSMSEKNFHHQGAELLFDTAFASMDYFFQKGKGHLRKIFLAISATRSHARQFLESHGLVNEGLLKNHYHDNRNEIVYSLFVAHKKI